MKKCFSHWKVETEEDRKNSAADLIKVSLIKTMLLHGFVTVFTNSVGSLLLEDKVKALASNRQN
jgi:hypothetical protein